EIGVESVPREGSTFWFTLTLPLATAPEPLPQADLKGVRVLVVDDNPVNQRIFSEQIRAFGMQVETLAKPEQALELLEREAKAGRSFRIVLLDHLMPNMDGEQLGRAILADPALPPIPPLVLLTSSAQRGDAQRFKEVGFAAYLPKPVLTDTLRRTLAGVLGAREQDTGKVSLVTRHTVAEARRAGDIETQEFSGRILLVEDNIVNRKVALSMLKRLGVDTDTAVNGQEAVERCQQETG
ncbi:MAG: response regulator, partial [Gammaproteobacteria bacterium]|nr:response regulator [Gammaproteobacteria bacterium]